MLFSGSYYFDFSTLNISTLLLKDEGWRKIFWENKNLNYDDAKRRIIHEVIKLTLEEKWSADSGKDKPADGKK